MRSSQQIVAQIEARLGFLPPLFVPAQQNPALLENLWQQTLFAYIDNPLPALLKEKLWAYLSHYYAIGYGTICHSCTLYSLGMKANQVLDLLQSPPPTQVDVDRHLTRLSKQSEYFNTGQEVNPVLEESLLDCSIFIALESCPDDCSRQLRQILGVVNYQHLVALIAHIKTCHEWMKDYPEVAYSADKRAIDYLDRLLQDEPGLAECFHNYQKTVRREQHNCTLERTQTNEYKLVESALFESEARYRSLVQAIAQVVWTTNAQGQVIDDLPGWRLLTGQSQEAIQGWGWLDAIHPDDRAETARQWTRAVTTQEIYQLEHRVRVIDGSYRCFLARGVPVFDREGKVLEWVGAHIDISDRQIAQQALYQSQTRFRQLIANLPGVVYCYLPCANASDQFIFVSSAARELLELEPEVVLEDASSFIQLIHPDDLASFQQSVAASAQNFLPWQWEGRIITPSGQLKWIHGSSRPQLAAEGDVWDGLLIDITERKIAQEALHQLTLKLESQVVERTAQLQQALEFEATLKRIADKVRDSLDESQILQTVVQELVVVLGVSCCNTALYNLEEGSSTICYEYATSNPQAQARTIQIAAFPEIYQQLLQGQYCQFCSLVPNPLRGQVAMLACPIVNDRGTLGDLWLIDQPDHAFNELEIRLVEQVANQCAIAIRQAQLYGAARTQVESLQKLNALKDDFLSTVSHELRTPLSNMKMALSMLKLTGTWEGKSQRYFEILTTECNREIGLVNDLLDLQRLEVQSYSLPVSEAINLQDCLLRIVAPFQIQNKQRQQLLKIYLPPDLPELVTETTSLERILVELLNNACKYTLAGGEIILSVEYKYALSKMQFCISNTTEIPAAHLSRIFEKFYRIPNADPWRQAGTGLGLALVQQLVQLLRGTMSVESSSGWTTFTIMLPNLPLSSN